MARVAVLGERSRVAGYALGGAVVLVAEDAAAVRAAWDELLDRPAGGASGDSTEEIAVLVLTRRAADALPAGFADRDRPLTVVMEP